jgi:flagellin
VKDGISLVQTAEGALQEVQDMLNRMVTLSEQSANGTYQDAVDRDNLQAEMDALTKEIDRIADSSNFNGIELLNGKQSSPVAKETAGVASIAAVAGTWTMDLSTASNGDTIKVDNSTITLNTGLASTYGVTITATGGGNYAVSFDSTTKILTFTEAAGKEGTVAAPTNGGSSTVAIKAGKTGSASVAATAAKTELDFTGVTGGKAIGGTVTMGGTTYEFVEDAAAYTGSNTAVEVATTDADTAVAAKLAQAVGTNVTNFTATSTGATFTLSETAAASTAGNLTAAEKVTTDGIGGLRLQIGDTADSFNQMTVSIEDMHASNLGIDVISVSNQDSAAAAIDVIKNAINQVSSTRGKLGATQNRLEHTTNNLSVMTENIQDAESTIRDTDIAEEMMSYTKNNILVQSAQAMLAQANTVPQGVLQLLQ